MTSSMKGMRTASNKEDERNLDEMRSGRTLESTEETEKTWGSAGALVSGSAHDKPNF